MKKNSKYMTRALKSNDPRYARILGKLGYQRRDLVAEDGKAPRSKKKIVDVSKEIENFHQQRQVQPDPIVQQESDQAIVAGTIQEQLEDQPKDDLISLRIKYKEVLGKQPYYGWDEETLRRKINEA